MPSEEIESVGWRRGPLRGGRRHREVRPSRRGAAHAAGNAGSSACEHGRVGAEGGKSHSRACANAVKQREPPRPRRATVARACTRLVRDGQPVTVADAGPGRPARGHQPRWRARAAIRYPRGTPGRYAATSERPARSSRSNSARAAANGSGKAIVRHTVQCSTTAMPPARSAIRQLATGRSDPRRGVLPAGHPSEAPAVFGPAR